MSFPNGPAPNLAPSIKRLMQFAQRKKMAQGSPNQGPPIQNVLGDGNLPGEPPLAQQIATANGTTIDPRLITMTQPQGDGVPYAPKPDTVGQEPPARLARMAGAQPQAPQAVQGMPMPAPLDLPNRTYEMPPVVGAPTLAPAPTRDVAAESNRALKSALIPAGFGLLLGGAQGALAGAQGAIAGSKARADQEATVADKAYATKRANDIQQYSLDRQETGDKTARVTQQMQVDARRDSQMTAAKRLEWEAWNKEQDRLAKARALQGGDTAKIAKALMDHRGKTADLMSTQPEDSQRRVAGDFNEIATSLGHPEMGFSIPESGPVFVMKPRDENLEAMARLSNARTTQVPVLAGNTVKKTKAEIENIKADNARADSTAKFDQWYKTRQVEISQGRLNAVTEKAALDRSNKSLTAWEDAQKEIASRMAKAAKLSETKYDPIMGVTTPPSEDERTAANMYIESGDGLAAKFGKTWGAKGWEDVKKPSTASAPKTSRYSLPSDSTTPVVLPPNSSGVRTIQPGSGYRPPSRPVTGVATPSPSRSTPAPQATPLPRTKDGRLDTSKLNKEQLTKIMMGKK